MTLGAPCLTWSPLDLSCVKGLPDPLDPDLEAQWAAVASEVLWALSGRRWGPCPVTVRPCRRSCLTDWLGRIDWANQSGSLVPYTINGVWRNLNLCSCSSSCSCGQLCEVRLQGPATSIVEVKLDGAVLDPDMYRLDQPGSLVRTDGECWPYCQDLAADDDHANTFAVTYDVGLPLSPGALAAASELTGHLLLGCLGIDGCKLPNRVTQIVRQGVAAQFIDPMQFLDKGRTGLYLVDLWLAAVNPQGSSSPGRVISPDAPSPRVVT